MRTRSGPGDGRARFARRDDPCPTRHDRPCDVATRAQRACAARPRDGIRSSHRMACYKRACSTLVYRPYAIRTASQRMQPACHLRHLTVAIATYACFISSEPTDLLPCRRREGAAMPFCPLRRGSLTWIDGVAQTRSRTYGGSRGRLIQPVRPSRRQGWTAEPVIDPGHTTGVRPPRASLHFEHDAGRHEI